MNLRGVLGLGVVLLIVACGPSQASPSASQAAVPTQAAGSQAAASEVPQEPVTLTLTDAATGGRNEAAEQVVAAFMAANPAITVKRTVVGDAELGTVFRAALAAGQGSDVFTYAAGAGYLGELVAAGLVLPIADAPGLDLSSIASPWAIDFGSYDPTTGVNKAVADGGVSYSLPFDLETLGVYYNETLVEQAGLTIPTTSEAMLKFCTDAKSKGYVPLAFSNNPGWQSFHTFAMTTNSALGSSKTRQLLYGTGLSWTDPAILQGTTLFFVDMVNAGCYPDDVNAFDYEAGQTLFVSGEALGLPTGGWLTQSLDAPDAMKDPSWKVTYTAFPGIGGLPATMPGAVTGGFQIWSGTEHPAEAAKFLQFVGGPEAAKIWLESGGVIGAYPIDPSSVQLGPLVKRNLELLQTGAEGGSLGYWIDTAAPAGFQDTMQSGFQAVIAGSKTPEQQLQDLQAAWTADQ